MSDIIFYNISSNKYGKLKHQIYDNFIFEPVVKLLIMVEEDYILKKNNKFGDILLEKIHTYMKITK